MAPTSNNTPGSPGWLDLEALLSGEGASVAQLSAAAVAGLAAWLGYYIAKGLFVVLTGREIAPLALLLAGVVGVLTARWVRRGEAAAPTVWSRGGLIGAGEWLLAGLVLTWYARRPVPTEPGLDVYQSGAMLGPGLVVMLGWMAAILMIALCLALHFLMKRLAAKSSRLNGEAPLW